MLNYRFTSPPPWISLGFTGQSEHLSYLSIIHVVGYNTMGFRIQALWINIPTYIVEWIKMEELGSFKYRKIQLNPKLELFSFVLYWNIWINILSLTYGDNGVVVGECHSGVHRPHVRGVDPTLPHLLDHRGQPLLQIVRSKSIQWYQQQRYLTARIKSDTYLY